MRFLMIDGHGDPNRGSEYSDALLDEAIAKVARNSLRPPPFGSLGDAGGGGVQSLHVGSYDDQAPVMGTLHEG